MATNQYNVLQFFSELAEIKKTKICRGGKAFLRQRFLSPEKDFFYDYEPVGFDINTGRIEGMCKVRKNDKKIHQNYINNAKHYVKKSFEALKNYGKKSNRHKKLWKGEDINNTKNEIRKFLKNDDWESADVSLNKLFEIFAKNAKVDYKS